MPTVRKYGTRQVGTEQLRGGERTAAETAESQGAGLAKARGERWETVGAVGGLITRVGVAAYTGLREQERKRANEVATLAWQNKIDQWELRTLYDPETGALNTRGEASFELPEKIDDEWVKLTGEIEKGLATPEQQHAFAKLKAQRGGNIAMNVRRHVAGEIRTYETAQAKATIEGAGQLAIANALDPRRVGEELTRGVEAIRSTGRRNGFSPEQIADQERTFRSTVHLGVIDNLLANEESGRAQAYFEEASAAGEIEGDKLDDVAKAIDAGRLRKEGQQESDRIIAAGGTLTEQREQARQITDPKLRDEVMQRVEHEATVRERAQREDQEQRERAAYDILDKTGDVSKIPVNEWQKFDGPTRSAMRSYAESKARGTPIKTEWGRFYSLMEQAGDDPEAFATVDLMKSRHLLDDGDFSRLADLQRQIKAGKLREADDALADWRTKEQMVDSALVQYGIDPNAKYDTTEGKAIAQLRRMLDVRVAALQAGGQKARNQDVQSELDNILGATVEVPGSWWAIVNPISYDLANKEKRLLDFTPADIKPADRKQIEAALRSKGRPVTEATILDLFLETEIRKRSRPR